MSAHAISITIDHRSIQCQAGQLIIEVADQAGIYIPRFCYHPKLTIAANCRMCLVEIEKSPKPLPACATPVAEGMCVYTRSRMALKAQKDIMSFLLINHPLDCPICDQGGECDLQDLALGYGMAKGQFDEAKRAVEDENLGPLVSTEMTRCIHCTRCVRFGDEIAGMPELGVMSRGGKAYIGTYLGTELRSELSGNVIDVCPVGALTAKPSRFHGRSWSFKQRAQVARHDCVGSHVYCHVQSHYTDAAHTIMRVLPRANEAVNEVWLSDRDRFSYEGLQHQRLMLPQVKRAGQWQTVSWQLALDLITDRLSGLVQTSDADQIAGVISSNATLEEGFLFQQWLRTLGVRHIDCRVRQAGDTEAITMSACPQIAKTLPELAQCSGCLLIEAFPRRQQPMLNHRIRQAALAGATVMALGSMQQDANYPLHVDHVVPVSTLSQHMAALVKAVLSLKDEGMPAVLSKSLASLEVTESIQAIAVGLISQASDLVILIGEPVLRHPDAVQIVAWAECLANLLSVQLSFLTEGSNTAGLRLSGCLPHMGPGGVPLSEAECGLSARASFQKGLKAYIVHDVMVEDDCMGAQQALMALKQAAFNVYISPFDSAHAREWADVMLPCAAGYETSGTLVNCCGDWQTTSSALAAADEVRPAWKIYAALLAWQQSEDTMQFDCIDSVTQVIQHATQAAVAQGLHQGEGLVPEAIEKIEPVLWGVAHWHDFRVDPWVRQAPALQAQQDDVMRVRCNRATAESSQILDAEYVQIRQGLTVGRFPLVLDESVADHTVIVPMTCAEATSLGLVTGPIEMEACK